MVLAARRTRSAPCSRPSRGRASWDLSRTSGNRRYYDLVERLFPAELLAEPARTSYEQLRHKLLSRYRAHGLLGRSGQAELWHRPGVARPDDPATGPRGELRAELVEAGDLLPVEIEGRPGRALRPPRGSGPARDGGKPRSRATRRRAASSPAAAFLAPLDPFVWDRDFLRRLYGFDYIWEVYVPEKKRRWGYYVLPILFGDRLVGRIEPRIDRKSGRPAHPRPVVGGGLRST